MPLEIDPPDHAKYRMLLNPMMSPKVVDAMEAGARARAVALVEDFKDKGECEVLNDFALPYAVGVALEFLGLPEERGMEFVGWAKAQLHGTPEERLDAMRTVVAYMKELLEIRKREPADDFMGVLVKSQVEGRPLFSGLLTFVSAAVGFPPFFAMAAVAGTLRMNAAVFFVAGFLGRILFFWAILLGVGVVVT